MGRLAQWQVWLATAILSVVAALSLWYGVTQRGQAGLAGPTAKTVGVPPESLQSRSDGTGHAAIDAGAAQQYAVALQENRCAAVIDLVWWMQERLRNVRIASGSDALRTEQDRLCAQVTDRSVGGGQLTAEGVEDQYIFRPGATFAPTARDEGRDDLDKPVAFRVWYAVSYGSTNAALHDDEGRAIRSLVVGVNVSEDGYILKAGVTGNTEIDWSTVNYDWTEI